MPCFPALWGSMLPKKRGTAPRASPLLFRLVPQNSQLTTPPPARGPGGSWSAGRGGAWGSGAGPECVGAGAAVRAKGDEVGLRLPAARIISRTGSPRTTLAEARRPQREGVPPALQVLLGLLLGQRDHLLRRPGQERAARGWRPRSIPGDGTTVRRSTAASQASATSKAVSRPRSCSLWPSSGTRWSGTGTAPSPRRRLEQEDGTGPQADHLLGDVAAEPVAEADAAVHRAGPGRGGAPRRGRQRSGPRAASAGGGRGRPRARRAGRRGWPGRGGTGPPRLPD